MGFHVASVHSMVLWSLIPGYRLADTTQVEVFINFPVGMAIAFGHVSTARLITNSKGGHLYYLVFAGPNPTGA